MLHVRVCWSMQFILRWSSVAYHTVILPFPGSCYIRACATHHFSSHYSSILHTLADSRFFISYISSPKCHLMQKSSKLIMVHSKDSSLQAFSHPSNAILHATSALLQVSQVLPASRVPRRHVLLHTVCEGGLLGRRDGRAGVGDGALEAVLVDFLWRVVRNNAQRYGFPSLS